MNKSVRKFAFSLALAASLTSTQASASGIPTVDVAAIAQHILGMLQQAMEAADQLGALEEQIEQLEKQYEQSEDQWEEHIENTVGNSGLGHQGGDYIYYDYIPTGTTQNSWEYIYSTNRGAVVQYRHKYGAISANPGQQEVFDTELANLRALENAHVANNNRMSQIGLLRGMISSTETPQEREDLLNRLAAEQADVTNESNRIATIQALMEKNEKLQKQKQQLAFSHFMANGE